MQGRGSTSPSPAVVELADHLRALRPDPVQAAALSRRVGAELLAASPRLGTAQFREIAPADLWLLLYGYDRTFLGERLTAALGPAPQERLRLRLSDRMTSSGGKIFHYYRRSPVHFEIAVSSHLLFANFAAGAAPVPVNGLPCHTRLDALQLIFEHELVHLIELLVWGRTSCRRAAFRTLAHTLFGHTEVTHRLPTPRQKAWQDHQLRPGDPVHFAFEGRRLHGFVNRITKRATVLVPDPTGQPYADGGRYAKYYVPVAALARGKR